MWQMDALRRLAGGELAEVLGPGTMDSILLSDEDARRWGLPRIAEMQERNLIPETRRMVAAYARGVNYWLETHRRQLPPEFSILNYDPRPWRLQDTILVALEMSRSLTGTWREQINKLQMMETGDAGRVNFLYPRRIGPEIQPGSNAWVVSGAHSATGKPILANDPHLQWSMPSVWHLVHLRAPDLDVTGATLPGVPAVIIGHNRRIAWGMTNLGFEVQDLYREEFDFATGHYKVQDRIEQARPEQDVIAVKGRANVSYNNWVTRDGRVFFTLKNQTYAMRWIPAENSPLELPLLSVDRAGNWDEFNAALKHFDWPAQNFVYADVDGNIGYHAVGRLPVRPPNCHPDLPEDGGGQCAWQGFIPYEKLPQAYNPPSGIIATANQNPFPADFTWPVDGRFAPKYRVQEIRHFLMSRPQWKADQMLTVQKDVYSAVLHFLAGQVAAAWEKHPDAKLRDAVELLRAWDGQMELGSAAAMIASLTFDEVRDAVAEVASPKAGRWYQSSMLAPQVVETLLRERPPGWFPDYDAQLLKSLSAAIDHGAKLQGSKLSLWNYGRYTQFTIENPVMGQLPLVGKYFNIGPERMSGSPTSIKQMSRALGPSMRMVVDLSDLDNSLENITTGESGHPLSSHYKDQWKSYYTGHSFPMEFDKIEAKQVLMVNPQ
jgi:penicillin amidase